MEPLFHVEHSPVNVSSANAGAFFDESLYQWIKNQYRHGSNQLDQSNSSLVDLDRHLPIGPSDQNLVAWCGFISVALLRFECPRALPVRNEGLRATSVTVGAS